MNPANNLDEHGGGSFPSKHSNENPDTLVTAFQGMPLNCSSIPDLQKQKIMVYCFKMLDLR